MKLTSELVRLTSKISNKSKICLALSSIIMVTFFVVETLMVFGIINNNNTLLYFGYGCITLFIPLFTIVVSEFLIRNLGTEVELVKKNKYLEHAAKLLRHDMHSGINVYIPRGLSSLERRLSDEQIKILKIESPLKMIKDGLSHTQKVYKGVYEFTDLVKLNSTLRKEKLNLYEILTNYLNTTSYKSSVTINKNLPDLEVNESLFCTAIDNLIRNGLKYNDSDTKHVRIYSDYIGGTNIYIEDNGRGMSHAEFVELSKPYVRKSDQAEDGSGLGLNICDSIMKEHGFKIEVTRLERGATDFYEEFNKLCEHAKENPKSYSLDAQQIEKEAKSNNYAGLLVYKRGGRNISRIYVSYKPEKIPVSKGTRIKIIT